MAISGTPQIGDYEFFPSHLWTLDISNVIDPSGAGGTLQFGRSIWHSVEGLEQTSETTEVIESGAETAIYILRQGRKSSPVTLRRHIAKKNSGKYQGQLMNLYRKGYTFDLTLTQYSSDDPTANPIVSYKLESCKATRYKLPDFNIENKDAALEELELVPADFDFADPSNVDLDK